MSHPGKHIIRNAYDAYWFLWGHPKLNCREGKLLETRADLALAKKWCKEKHGGKIITIRDCAEWAEKKTQKLYEFRLKRHAIETNLDIHYAKVNSKGRVDDDPNENVNIEVWLEFGANVHRLQDGQYMLTGEHDIRLDCGAPSFDEALVKLAHAVRRYYGDYKRGDE